MARQLPPEGDFEGLQSAPINRLTDQKTKRTSFSLPESMETDLKAYAKRQKKSVSKTVCRAIETQIYIDDVINEGGQVIIRRGNGELFNFNS